MREIVRSGYVARRSGVLLGVAAAVLALSACGSSAKHHADASAVNSSASTTSAASSSKSQSASGLHAATIKVSTSATLPNGAIDPRYTCHGSNVPPPFKWKGVEVAAPQAQELLVFVRSIIHGQVSTAWALGVPPTTTGITAGQTPPGAIVGRDSSGTVGYSLCPPPLAFVTMAVYALPHKLHLSTGFDPHKVQSLLESAAVQWGGTTVVASVPATHS